MSKINFYKVEKKFLINKKLGENERYLVYLDYFLTISKRYNYISNMCISSILHIL